MHSDDPHDDEDEDPLNPDEGIDVRNTSVHRPTYPEPRRTRKEQEVLGNLGVLVYVVAIILLFHYCIAPWIKYVSVALSFYLALASWTLLALGMLTALYVGDPGVVDADERLIAQYQTACDNIASGFLTDTGFDAYSNATDAESGFFADQKKELGTICKQCHVWRPPMAHHCRICQRCVRQFDHHCGILGRCIGEQNHRYFIGLLLAAVGAHFTLFLCMVTLMLQRDGSEKSFVVWAFLVFFAYVAFTILGATVWQLVLLGNGVTGYQRMKGTGPPMSCSLGTFCSRVTQAFCCPSEISKRSPSLASINRNFRVN